MAIVQEARFAYLSWLDSHLVDGIRHSRTWIIPLPMPSAQEADSVDLLRRARVTTSAKRCSDAAL